jgi:hypothetical protein
LGSQVAPPSLALPAHSVSHTSSAPLLSTQRLHLFIYFQNNIFIALIPPASNTINTIDLPPGVDESDGPPGISSSIPPVSMPPPPRMDFSQPPPTRFFSSFFKLYFICL